MTEANERALEILAEAVRIRDEARAAIRARRDPNGVQPARSRRGSVSKPITYRRCCVCGQAFEGKGLWRHQDQTGHSRYEMYRIYLDLGDVDA